MVSVGWTQNYSSSVGITLKPKIMTSTDTYGNRSMITGFESRLGRVGFNVDPGSVKFGRFQDPRAILRNHLRNRVDVDSDSGTSRRHPLPSSTGGQISTKGMTYDEIKDRLRGTGQLFEDPDFPAEGSSLFYSTPAPRDIQWKRPHEFCSDPKFVSGGTSRFDVRQGELGDCWLLAAVANLSLYEDLLAQVIPPDQEFNRDYCGVFRFVFWRFGEWVEVVVDDRLPTRNGRLVFMHSVDRDEFWSALLEKAYAKLFGSYESLRGGSTIEALEDFTGGLAEYYDLRGKQPADLFKILTKCYARQTLMASSISPDPNVLEAQQPNGLIRGHAYSITKVAQVDTTSGSVQLLRLRNPWGNEAEWKGRWSDSSSEWRSVSESQRRELGLSIEADGEFWMCYDDFVNEFEKIEMCALGPQSLNMDESCKKVAFEMTLEHGGWQPGVNAGGCRNFLETFWTNPQYRVEVEDADDDDNENLGTLIVGLMQKDRRKMRKQGAELLTIGFMIYSLKEQHEGLLDLNFFKYNAAVARSPAFINTREVTGRFRLPPGTYVIVPSTFAKNERADFLLRIFSEKVSTAEQIDDSVGMEEPEQLVGPAKPGAMLPEPISESQVVALKNAFEKVCGPDGEITADELIDILNVAFTKELNEGREGTTKAPAPAPVPVTVRATSRGFSLLCCGLGQKAESDTVENGPSGAKAGPEAGDHDFTFDGFSIEACRSLISMLDVDRSGSLDFEEFKVLWEILRFWKAIFKKFDADNSGTMSTFELRNALNCAGYHIDNATLTSVVLRFSNRDRVLRFNDYIICCARLRTAFETMKTGESYGGAQKSNQKTVF
ncbi:Calpain-A [Taenia solium]|eukprot:TsM_000468600 transcript=TsM_000468600 gene=TsM_000468600